MISVCARVLVNSNKKLYVCMHISYTIGKFNVLNLTYFMCSKRSKFNQFNLSLNFD